MPCHTIFLACMQFMHFKIIEANVGKFSYSRTTPKRSMTRNWKRHLITRPNKLGYMLLHTHTHTHTSKHRCPVCCTCDIYIYKHPIAGVKTYCVQHLIIRTRISSKKELHGHHVMEPLKCYTKNCCAYLVVLSSVTASTKECSWLGEADHLAVTSMSGVYILGMQMPTVYPRGTLGAHTFICKTWNSLLAAGICWHWLTTSE